MKQKKPTFLWLRKVGTAFTTEEEWRTPIEANLPTGTEVIVKYMPAYGMKPLASDLWRSPEHAAYVASQTETTLEQLRTAANARLVDDMYDEKLMTLTPDTFSCVMMSMDDKTYGGAIIVSSKMSVAKIRVKIKKDAIRLHEMINLSEDWIDHLKSSFPL